MPIDLGQDMIHETSQAKTQIQKKLDEIAERQKI
jgi:hypothetical protein